MGGRPVHVLWVLQAAARTALGAGRNREFHQIRALGAILKAGTRANSETYSKIVVEAEDIITVGGTVVTEHVLRF